MEGYTTFMGWKVQCPEMAVFPGFLCGLNVIIVRIIADYFFTFGESKKLILKCIWTSVGQRIAKAIFREN